MAGSDRWYFFCRKNTHSSLRKALQCRFLFNQEKAMKKRDKIKLPTDRVVKNPVAKYARQFNKAQVFKDKTGYQRGAKHKGREPFIMSLSKGITKGCLFLSLLGKTPHTV